MKRKTKKGIKNLLTGRNIKKKPLKIAVLQGLFLPYGHIIIARSGSLFHVKNNYGIFLYDKDQIFDLYGVELTEKNIKRLSIK